MNANELNECIGLLLDHDLFEQDRKRIVRLIRQQKAEIEVLKEVLIKVKELLEQSTEIDFDDMAHIAITSEDECDMRELIEKILSGEDDDEDR